MKKMVKRPLVMCLVLCMLLTMLPMLSGSAAAPALDVITDVEHKTVQINGNIPEMAGGQVSIMIMDPSFNGDFSTVFENMDLIVAMDQAAVDADGKFTFSTVLTSADTAEGYYVFVNGAACTTQFVFDEPYTILAGEKITLPIIVKNCEKFSGLTGAVNYDADLWIFEGFSSSDGFILCSQDNRFITITADGKGVDGDTVAGYIVLTAKANLNDDALTTISFDVVDAANEAREDVSVRIQSLKVSILMTVIPGDVDLDGFVNMKDVILLLQYLARTADLSARQLRAANVLEDGLINTADAVLIMQMCL